MIPGRHGYPGRNFLGYHFPEIYLSTLFKLITLLLLPPFRSLLLVTAGPASGTPEALI